MYNKVFSRNSKKHPGMAIMNPERLISPRTPKSACSKPNIAAVIVEVSDGVNSSTGSSRGLRQYENMVLEADLPVTKEINHSDLSDSDQFLRRSREQTVPSFDTIAHTLPPPAKDNKHTQQSASSRSRMPVTYTNAAARAETAAALTRRKNESTIRIGAAEAAHSGIMICLSPAKVRGRAPAHLQSHDPPITDSDEPDCPTGAGAATTTPAPPRLPAPPRADCYRQQKVQHGAGFSALLLSLDPLLPTGPAGPAAALLGAPRLGRRLNHAVQTIGAVGLAPPRLDDRFLAAQSLKRQWVIKYRTEPLPGLPPSDRPGPAAKQPTQSLDSASSARVRS
jgi:hypothetical protein